MEAVKTEKLTKYYGKSRGIVDLDLSVGEGEYFGFIGPNGAGKSTTIRSLLGLITPTSGKGSVFGRDIVAEKDEILRDVGYIPSEAIFYSGMKGKDIIKLSSELRGVDCSARASGLCERLELDTSKKVDELSFGNRKKLAIVCALQSSPRLLILDEPTGGLDPLIQHEFFEMIKEQNEQGATVFLSSHILTEVQRNCTRAAVIKEGRIIASGSVEALSKTRAKRVSLRGRVDVERLEGIKDVIKHGDAISFLYSGEIKALLDCLASGEVSDLSISEPDLEEIFLHYYEKAGDEA
ncbi:MAG: ABC transporter ATP-binding protein [Clostridia bacterium]|nr:ABC transporter ATP-binding protein [Clostridia bacterium]